VTSAIDTNIVSTLWAGSPASDIAAGLLLRARRDGSSVICGAVYTELLAGHGITQEFVDDFLAVTNINVDFEMPKKIWQLAGLHFSHYARRRKIATGEAPRRLMADFVIGAHAMLCADRLISFNTKDFRKDFPELTVMDSLRQ
jgi:predicted nucleic acid-binding protein